MARIVLMHALLGYAICESADLKEKLEEGWQETKITPEQQEEAEALSERENARDPEERAAEHHAALVDAAGGQEKFDKMQAAKKAKEAKRVAKEGDKQPPADAPKAAKKAKPAK